MSSMVNEKAAFDAALKHRIGWLISDALPLWADAGVDPSGGFFEQVDQAGRPVTHLPRRARVVARQTYVFATAVERGWGTYTSLVDHGAVALFECCLRSDGLALSTYAADGTPLNEQFDGYDQAFVLFALATLARTRPDLRDRASTAGERLLKQMQAQFSHPQAGFQEAMPPRAPLLQNPHMHLLEACLAFDAVPGAAPLWRTQAGALVALAMRHLSHPATGAIHEYFDLDWQAIIDADGGAVEPGHQFEWAWLLWQWHDRVGDSKAAALAKRLHAIGTEHGRAADGQVIDVLDATLVPRARTLRLWPQTERLKACLAAVEQNAEEGVHGIAGAREALDSLSPYFDTPIAGLWYDRLGDDGVVHDAPAPASSLYHIVCALDYAQRFAERQGQ